MELRQLVYFDAIVRHGGFTRAAEKLRIAQPAVSAQLRRLESELGVALLARTTRQVDLTQAGEVFLTRVRRALAEIEQGRGELADLASAARGKVVVGATPVLGTFDLPGALAAFTAAHPQVEVSLRSALLEPMLDELGDRYDLVLGPLPTSLRDGLESTPLAAERFVVITPPGHALATRGRLGWPDLADEVFVSLPPETGLRAHLTDYADTRVEVRYEAESPRRVQELVAAGLGVALTVESEALSPRAPRVGVHDLQDAPAHPPYGLITPSGDAGSPAARALAGHLRRHRGAGTIGPSRSRPPR